MPILINNDTQLAEQIDPNQADQVLDSGTHSIPLVNPEGDMETASKADWQQKMDQGYSGLEPHHVEALLNQAKYSSTGEQVKGALEEAGRAAITAPVMTGIEKVFGGAKDEDILGREENLSTPVKVGAGIAGLVGSSWIPGIGQAGVLAKVGSMGAKAAEALKIAHVASEMGAAGRIAGVVGRIGLESAAMQTGDEVSHLMLSDPNQSAGTALSNIGMAGAIGGALGLPFGVVPEIWQVSKGGKVAQIIEDAKARFSERAANPDPATALADEATTYVNNLDKGADEVFGAKGLKNEAINSLMPEMNEGIQKQTQEISSKLNSSLENLKANEDPNLKYVSNEFNKWSQKVSAEGATSADVFHATNDLKKEFQQWGRYNEAFPTSPAEQRFRNFSKDLTYDLRNALEDSNVWGKAGDVQQKINSAFSEYLPTLKDFRKKFMQKMSDGTYVIEPGKFQTFINQTGKLAQKTKQDILGSFFEKSNKYKDVINEIHQSIGSVSPMEEVATHHIQGSLQTLSTGAKIADAIINKGLAQTAGKSMGAIVGGTVGHAAGVGALGALIGEHTLGGLFSSILPTIIKPLLAAKTSAAGFKSAVDYGMAVIQGEKALNRATLSIFKPDAHKSEEPAVEKKELNDIQKIQKKIDNNAATDVATLMKTGGDLGHLMPEHAQAMAKHVASGMTYLQSKKPNQDPTGILDSPKKVSQAAQSAYDRTTRIANNPNVVLASVARGTVTSSDVQDLMALHPAYLQRAQSKITEQLINHKSEGKQLNYKTKLGLSRFLGTPLDSTMTPQALQAVQGSGMNMPSQPQGGAPQGKQHGQMAKLDKLSSMYSTPLTARQQSRQK